MTHTKRKLCVYPDVRFNYLVAEFMYNFDVSLVFPFFNSCTVSTEAAWSRRANAQSPRTAELPFSLLTFALIQPPGWSNDNALDLLSGDAQARAQREHWLSWLKLSPAVSQPQETNARVGPHLGCGHLHSKSFPVAAVLTRYSQCRETALKRNDSVSVLQSKWAQC
jgi:hypothetical protein